MSDPIQLGRYSLFAKLASGGMATVYLGRLHSEFGFGRTVAIKRLHPHLAGEAEFVSMFLDEARLAARIQHPNVVQTVDVVTMKGELFLVMDYVRGESLGGLVKEVRQNDITIPVPVVAACGAGLLAGLHAAHEAKDERGRPLSIVHRDISPQNVLVGADGVTRVLDFGVAKAASRLQTTRDGQVKGKLSYMPPEQILGEVSRQTDIYSAGVVLWEALACRRLFVADSDGELIKKVMVPVVLPPSKYNAEVPPELDRVVLRALAPDPDNRWATAEDMAEEIDRVVRLASPQRVSEWVRATAAEKLSARDEMVAQIESGSSPDSTTAVQRQLSQLPSLESSVPGNVIPPASAPPRAKASDMATSPTVPSVSRDARATLPPSRSLGYAAFGAALLVPVGLYAAFLGGQSAAPAALVAAGVASAPVTRAPAPSVTPIKSIAASTGWAPVAVDAGAAAPSPTIASPPPVHPSPPAAPPSRPGLPRKAHDYSSLIDTR
jgi:eukaryotic-like serine/threonine-protein kinase